MSKESYYVAAVYGTGKFFIPYRAEVYCQHPNGQSAHWSAKFPWMWLAKWAAYTIAIGKHHQLRAYWEKRFEGSER